MLSPKTKRNISRIIPFGIIWLVSGWIFLIVEFAAQGGTSEFPSSAIRMDLTIFIFSSLAITTVGLFVGTIELVYLHDVFAKKSFAAKILYKLFIYALIMLAIIAITYPIAVSMELDTSIFDKRVWTKFMHYQSSLTNLSTIVQMGVALGASLFYAEISDNIGQGVLLNFFTGKYHQPVEERRIFMFLDMKSSTTIAEKLGHIQYFRLLNEYYADLSGAIVDHAGEIYQYVGDEIVVSWKFNNGVRNNNCIRCFYAMKEDLEERKNRYMDKYGLLPAFKAGFHYGNVTTGEIGTIKKEIIFTGDVLNTTARIQGLCNNYQVDILISGALLKHLSLDEEFSVKSLGQAELRGKSEMLELITLV